MLVVNLCHLCFLCVSFSLQVAIEKPSTSYIDVRTQIIYVRQIAIAVDPINYFPGLFKVRK